jgi:hypothetical protein
MHAAIFLILLSLSLFSICVLVEALLILATRGGVEGEANSKQKTVFYLNICVLLYIISCQASEEA